MKSHSKKQRVKPSSKVNLSKLKTRVATFYKDDDEYKKLLTQMTAELRDIQEEIYASGRYAFLIVFQGMDTAGKDGAISHVMAGLNPQGVQVSSFKQPSTEELRHDFLWRTVARLPARGDIGIFNRSYYEEVLVTRVHSEELNAEKMPGALKNEKGFWHHRLQDITNHEAYLERQGMRIIKFFLHISKEEQAKRLRARFDEKNKIWKISEADFKERKYWKQYMHAYEQCLQHTSSKSSPWYVIPGDDKKNARIMISTILLEQLKSVNLEYPKVSPKRRQELLKLAKKL
jgi:PPK2 family polyphosphate:nucleotide phosphotransferase